MEKEFKYMHPLKQTLIKLKHIIFKAGSYLFLTALLGIISYASIITVTNDLNKEDSSDTPECNVLGINLHGYLNTYISKSDYGEDNRLLYDETASEDIVWSILEAEKNEAIKAIILEVDSSGGSATAGFEVNQALEKATKPTVAYIRNTGASAAYLSAIAADRVLASRSSDVGSIGVTASYLDNSKKNKKDGIVYNELTSGKFKDTGNTNKPLSPEESDLIMRDIKIIHQTFVEKVAERRELSIDAVQKLADGSTMLGDMALEHNLIDQIGGYYEAKAYLSDQIGEEVEVCWE